MAYYLGIDVGTTNIKAAVYSDIGEVIATTTRITPKILIDNGYMYQADIIFQNVILCLKELSVMVGAESIRALAVSSFAESGLLLEKDGAPLTKTIAWFDTRSIPQAQKLIRKIGDRRLFDITGQIPSSKFGITKLMWHMENEPELFEKSAYWMSVNDYILYRLSGERVCDYSIAARTMAFDIHNLTWSEEVCSAAGVDTSMLGSPLPGGTKIGTIRGDIAEKTGLPLETAVVTGGQDHPCAMIGSGALREGSMLSSMGTSEVTMFALKEIKGMDKLYKGGYCVEPHCSERLYRAFGSLQASGASIEWFLKSIGKPVADMAEASGQDKYALLGKIAEEHKTDERLMYFPLIRGSLTNQDAGGLFIGIRDYHELGDFAKALLDGMCSEFTYQTETGLEMIGVGKIDSVQVVGGPSKSAYLMQRKADISGLTVDVAAKQEAACYGAALLAAIGVGELTFKGAVKSGRAYKKEYFPIENGARRLYSKYRDARSLVDSINAI